MHDILCTNGVSVDDVYQQFLIDAPRTTMIIRRHDGTDESGCPIERDLDPKVTFTALLNSLSDFADGFMLAHCCTQTALAHIYLHKWMRVRAAERVRVSAPEGGGSNGDDYVARPTVHLVDDGVETIDICGARVRIFKPFRIVVEEPYFVRTTQLDVEVDVEKRIASVEWSDEPSSVLVGEVTPFVSPGSI